MTILLKLNATDDDRLDPADDTGLSQEGYNDLITALSSAGFEVVEGPEVVA